MVPFKGTLKGYHDRGPRRRSVARTETFTAFRPLPDLDTWIGIKAGFDTHTRSGQARMYESLTLRRV